MGPPNFEKLVKKLIQCTTNFHEDEENFVLCRQYITSNFKYHKFLDPDSHKLNRTIQGLSEKFKIHCQPEKSAALENLVDQFLSQPLSQENSANSSTHYAILSLLLNLADKPLDVPYIPCQTTEQVVDTDNFDWISYLKEDWDTYNPFNEPDSPEWSDESDNDETGKHISFAFPLEVSSEPCEDKLTREGLGAGDSGGWLEKNLIVRYWKDGSSFTQHSDCRSSNLSDVWEHYLSTSNPLHISSNTTEMTEYQVIREIIWMLCGTRDLFIFKWQDSNKCFSVNPNVHLSHLTQGSLWQLLTKLGEYGGTVRKLRDFMDETIQCTCHPDESPIRTYQAFAAALSEYLQSFTKQMVVIEQRVKEEGVQTTLSSLYVDLKPHLLELELLEQVYQQGIMAYTQCGSPCRQASGLLAVMYKMLLQTDTLGHMNNCQVELLLPLWIKTCKPYIDIINNWINKGSISDVHKEFIVHRNETSNTFDETFWDTAFEIECSEDSDKSITFLAPVLHDIVLAGKSMHLLQNLGCLKDVHQEHKLNLFETFISSLKDYLGEKPVSILPTSPSIEIGAGDSDVLAQNVKTQMLVRDIRDPLLRINFQQLLKTSHHELHSEAQQQMHLQMSRLDLQHLTPLQLILAKCLYPHITARYALVSQKLLHIMSHQYKLLDNLSLIRKFYLMEAGDTMYDFYTEIFEKLRLQEDWQDLSWLNLSLQEALQAHYSKCTHSIFVSLEKVENPASQPITVLDGLTLHFKVDWPLDVILNGKCMGVYNKVFRFLLQIKRAKYSLDELRFTDLNKEGFIPSDPLLDETYSTSDDAIDKKQFVHKMQVFRMRLMHFVNSLHNYIMTRILHSAGLEFLRDLEEAKDLDQLISIHNHYVARLYERCLLHRGVAIIKDVVTKVLNLCLKFHTMWARGENSKSVKVLSEMETEFSRCFTFLSSFLNKTIKRGSFPHLESLAFALVTSSRNQDLAKE